jgi:hypothetical protein
MANILVCTASLYNAAQQCCSAPSLALALALALVARYVWAKTEFVR